MNKILGSILILWEDWKFSTKWSVEQGKICNKYDKWQLIFGTKLLFYKIRLILNVRLSYEARRAQTAK